MFRVFLDPEALAFPNGLLRDESGDLLIQWRNPSPRIDQAYVCSFRFDRIDHDISCESQQPNTL